MVLEIVGFSVKSVVGVFFKRIFWNLKIKPIWSNGELIQYIGELFRGEKMEELGTINITLIRDRGFLKKRINIVRKGTIVGCLKPAKEEVGTRHTGVFPFKNY